MRAGAARLPAWIDHGLVPAADLAVALALSGLVVMAAGASPAAALATLVRGAAGDGVALGHTLYYATNLVFTGLAVALAFHGGFFNIGGEGQAVLGGLGAGLAALALDDTLPAILLVPVAIAASLAFGAGWAAAPAWLQARRGSHIVITTIMFNFLAASLFVYLMVNVLIEPGSMSPESRAFAPSASVPSVRDLAGWAGVGIAASPLNLSVLIAAAALPAAWFVIWRTRFGYELRLMGQNPDAARYAGVDLGRTTMIALCASGALAGLVGVNEILGVHHRLILNFTAGYGFAGIAVALMGRNHPVGIALASLLLGALYQGGTELNFEIPALSRDLVLVVQGLVILLSGAFAGFTRPLFARLMRVRRG